MRMSWEHPNPSCLHPWHIDQVRVWVWVCLCDFERRIKWEWSGVDQWSRDASSNFPLSSLALWLFNLG
ncbi:hypothetical protein HanRHA438_Chr05g0230771 [Helianthus annuus]|nr:hypothetical protein HanIR_Chr05g0238641 [Helianthus annuus]KAJ0919530.1 hypothetical protein HanRHA438_Chr05g0230771 [Helianthus annuus]